VIVFYAWLGIALALLGKRRTFSVVTAWAKRKRDA